MKKFKIISAISIALILLLQVSYIYGSYKEYIQNQSNKLEEILYSSINFELIYRGAIRQDAPTNTFSNYKMAKGMSDMTRAELDSLLDIMPLPKLPVKRVYNVKELIEKGVVKNSGDMQNQKTQDFYYEDGFKIDLKILYSLFTSELNENIPHKFTLLDKNMDIVEYAGDSTLNKYNYISNRQHIGLKGYNYVDLIAFIPLSSFLKNSIYIIILSLLTVVVVSLCFLRQLKEIKDKSEQIDSSEISVNGIIHDLKSPLVSIIALLDVYMLKANNSELQTITAKNKVNVESLIHRIESLLSSVNKNRRAIILNKIDIPISSLAESVELINHNLSLTYSHKQSIFFVNNLTKDNSVVSADKMYLESSIRELIENSLKYSDDKVEIDISFKIEDEMLVIVVSDNGCGIDKREIKKIFRQFYRAKTKYGSVSGYGIGLAHIKNIIEAHKGTISVESLENSGTKFKILLPLC